jgi:hypothetical protein
LLKLLLYINLQALLVKKIPFLTNKIFDYVTKLFALICSWIMTSCQKDTSDEVIPPASEPQVAASSVPDAPTFSQVFYLLDGQEVTADVIEPGSGKYLLGITAEKIDEDSGILTFHGFTSREKYVAWGEENGFPVALSLEMGDHLRTYAEANGVIEHYEKTGEVLPAYLDYEQQYYAMMTGTADMVNERSGTAMLHKNWWGGSPSAPLAGTLPVMWPGWNNEVSAYFPLCLYCGLTVYDRTFYRKNLGTIWEWGYELVPFINDLSKYNDKMSSTIRVL